MIRKKCSIMTGGKEPINCPWIGGVGRYGPQHITRHRGQRNYWLSRRVTRGESRKEKWHCPISSEGRRQSLPGFVLASGIGTLMTGRPKSRMGIFTSALKAFVCRCLEIVETVSITLLLIVNIWRSD